MLATPSKTSHSSAQRGFSLIELMIAMALGIVLTWGIVTFFQDSLSSSRTSISSSNMQDVAQTALKTIQADVRMAGFRGRCIATDTEFVTGSVINAVYSVMGEDGAGTASDTLRIYGGDIQSEELFLWDYVDATQQLTVCKNPQGEDADGDGTDDACAPAEYNTTDLLLLSDCHRWAVFSPDKNSTESDPAAVSFSPNETIDLSDLILPGSDSHQANANVKTFSDEMNPVVLFKVGSTTSLSPIEYEIIQDTNPQHALRNGDQPSILFRNGEPFVYGVENFQVLYGRKVNDRVSFDRGCVGAELASEATCHDALNDNGNPDNGVVQIRISLVIQSDQRTETGINQTFIIANPAGRNIYTPATADSDGRLRQVYSTTIQLRNILL